ncbi:DUF2790 domain-containing protein [Pseudomonas sp. 21LCFQ010]|uniref:DUF2790 domain-containing protein n=1 Tax=Pseudomonas sp. 21LCFQ010 TaxID=2957506 RepID=UPI0020979F04|nr:DUF2790 domain-containing protein [Pseudomonas sp. 21LCFQ010]MCO8165891.1 DUF2790 domain-containing protein [Pseudomonas sp. 21LCFQ010]
MRMFKMLFAGLVLTLPLAAQAYSPNHTFSDKTAQAWRETVQQYADKAGQPAPQIEEYRYGMPLDVAQVKFQSPLGKTCDVVSRLMVYEDTQGTLKAVRYQAMSDCRSNQ